MGARIEGRRTRGQADKRDAPGDRRLTKATGRGAPAQTRRAPLRTPLFFRPLNRTYWQASQVPPLRIASIEQAFFSSAVYSFFAAFGAFSTVAFSMLEAPRVRR